MNRSSKWYNPEAKEYKCDSCGVMYQFYVNGLCSVCRTPERNEMAKKLLKMRNKDKVKNIEFAKNHVKRK